MSFLSFLGIKSSKELCDDAFELEKKGKYNDAIPLYLKAIENDPQYACPYNELAWIFAIHNYELDKALEYVNKAIRFEDAPRSKAIYYDTLAEIYMRKGLLDDAITELKRCLSKASTFDHENPDWGASFRIGWCYMLKSDMNNALDFLKRALRVETKNPLVYSHAGYACLGLQRYMNAISYYQRAIELSPKWNFHFPVVGHPSTDEQLQVFLSICWCNTGEAYYYLENYEKCRYANEQSYKSYKLPTPIINLASLSAKRKEKVTMRHFLEEGIPLIEQQQNIDLITSLLTHPNFEEYRDIVLDLLKSHGKITQNMYIAQMKYWKENRSRTNKSSSVTLAGPIGNVVIGPNTNLKEAKMTIFDQKNQHVAYQYNAAGNINFDTVKDKIDLVGELEKLKAELSKAAKAQVIDAEFVTDADYQITKAINQALKPEPSKKTILDHLNNTKNAIQGVTTTAIAGAAAVEGIVKALTKAAALVQQLFK